MRAVTSFLVFGLLILIMQSPTSANQPERGRHITSQLYDCNALEIP